MWPYLLKGLRIERANHVWCADITYIPVQRGFLYLVAIMDCPTRRALFEANERALLKPLPRNPWEWGEWIERKVGPNCHVRIARNHYSVPERHIGREIHARVGERMVELFLDKGGDARARPRPSAGARGSRRTDALRRRLPRDARHGHRARPGFRTRRRAPRPRGNRPTLSFLGLDGHHRRQPLSTKTLCGGIRLTMAWQSPVVALDPYHVAIAAPDAIPPTASP